MDDVVLVVFIVWVGPPPPGGGGSVPLGSNIEIKASSAATTGNQIESQDYAPSRMRSENLKLTKSTRTQHWLEGG